MVEKKRIVSCFARFFANFAAELFLSREMYKICSLVILFLVSTFALANPISQQQALRKAQDFAEKRLRISNSGKLRLVHVEKAKEQAGWYAFNLTGKRGFVIVSGNDQTDGILGYADQGEFDYDNMPENMRVWLEQYAQSIEAISKGVLRPARNIAGHPTEVVEPLITSMWGQKDPYNSMCPQVNSTRCPAGCTAVAMAQVMRYHHFPTTSTNVIPAYTTSSLGIDMPELQSTTFDWDKMPDQLSSDTPQESIDEVAKLLLYCGQATEMNYDATGSGAFTDILPQRMPQYFNYPKTIHYVYRKSYSEEEWDSLLVRELTNGRPVIYTAYTNLGAGHTFVCDGYDGQGLYHINWGWLGAGNGYYRISVACAQGENLDENIKNYQLSINQSALLGIKPRGNDDFVAPDRPFRVCSRPSIKGGYTYTRTTKKNPFKDISIKQTFNNTTAVTKSLYYGLALCDKNDNIVAVVKAVSTSLKPYPSLTFEASNLELGAGFSGHYTLKAVYKLTSSGSWQLMGGTDQNYVEMEMTDREMTLTPVPKANFVVNDVRMEKDVLTINFDNNDEDFYGPIYLRKLVPSTGQITQVAYDNMFFESGSNREFGIYVDPSKKFDMHADEFYLSVDEYDTHYFYTNVSEGCHLDKQIELLNLSDDLGTIVGDRIMCRVKVSNNDEKAYNNYLTVSSLDSNNNLEESHRELISLQPGESLVKEYDVPISDFTAEYALVVSTKDNVYEWVSDTTEMKPVAKGAIYWTKDGVLKTMLAAKVFHVPEEALAINLHNAYTSNVVPNSNPNTIYMLDRTIPSGLTSSNFINASNKGNKLTLVDGYDYYFPIEMSFSGIVSYQREIADTVTFNWSTLSLPFTPAEVLADDAFISWYADAEAEEGDFWLFNFEGVENDTVRTSFSKGVKANVPCVMACDERLAGKTIYFQTLKTTIAPTVLHPTVTKGETQLISSNTQETIQQGYVISGNQWVSVSKQADMTDDDGYGTTDDTVSDTTDETSQYMLDVFRAYLSSTSETLSDTLAIDAEDIIHPKEPPYVLLGDVNNDGFVNMSDVTIIINYILGMSLDTFVFDNADVIGDGFINMSDVTAVIGIILGTYQIDNTN